MKRLVMIGLGGNSFGPLQVGLWLSHRYPDATLVLVDGKEYRPSQRDHEFFLRMGPKTHVQALLLHSAYPKLTVVPIQQFVDRTTTDQTIGASDVVQEGDYVIAVVDNHETRKLLAEHATTLPNITLIVGGIDGNDVGVWVYLRRNNHELTPSPLQRYPDIANASTVLPQEMFLREGCLEEGLTTKSEDRPNYFALLTTTTLTLNALWLALDLDATGRIALFPYVDTWLNVQTATATPNQRKEHS